MPPGIHSILSPHTITIIQPTCKNSGRSTCRLMFCYTKHSHDSSQLNELISFRKASSIAFSKTHFALKTLTMVNENTSPSSRNPIHYMSLEFRVKFHVISNFLSNYGQIKQNKPLYFTLSLFYSGNYGNICKYGRLDPEINGCRIRK